MSLSSSSMQFGFSSVSTVTYRSSSCRKPHPVLAQSGSSRRQVWRRRKLTKEDDMRKYRMERVPFLEEQVRNIRESGKLIQHDIEWLQKSVDNKYAFVNMVAAEATELMERNPDDYYGAKKPILHVLSNMMNDAGFSRPDAYEQSDLIT
ncbi:Protein PLASTID TRANSCRIPTIONALLY ACTIVE 7 [Linum grandiflorum]